MWYTVFVWYWLISLSIMLSKSIHVATNGKISFFVCLSSIPLYVWVLATQSCLTLSTQWTVAGQALLSMLFSRQEYRRNSHSCFQVIFPTQGWTQVSHIAGRFFNSWATREAQEYWGGYPIPSPVELTNPGIKPGSPALLVDPSPTELSEKPAM